MIRLRRFSHRPKTVDAYARNLARYLAWFDEAPAERWLEADEGDLLGYLDDLRNGRVPGIGAGQKRALPQNVVPLSGSRIAEATVAQHVVTLRQFYEYLIRARLRSDPINPVDRGTGRRTGDTAQRGFVRRRGRLPWVAPAEVWERIVLHVIVHETSRNRAMVLVALFPVVRSIRTGLVPALRPFTTAVGAGISLGLLATPGLAGHASTGGGPIWVRPGPGGARWCLAGQA